MQPALDQHVESIVHRYYRLAEALFLLVSGAFLVVAVFIPLAFGPVAGGVTVLGILLAGAVPLFEIRTEGILATGKSPETVVAEFEAVVNPLTAFGIGWADEVDEVRTENSDTAVRLRGTFLRLFDQEYRVRTTRTDERSVDIRFGTGEDADAVIELSVEQRDDETRVRWTGREGGKRMISPLFMLLHDRFERQVLEQFGYRTVESSTRFTPRFR